MRLLYYNIAYATGAPRSHSHSIFTFHRYLRASRRHFDMLRKFIVDTDADITAVVEVDSGSIRASRCNHVSELAEGLSHHHTFASKYHRGSIGRFLPILRHQGNAIFTRRPATRENTHFLTFGFKRLVLEMHVEGIEVYLVHLALNRDTRVKQLHDLRRITGHSGDTPVIVAGDFNAYRGVQELEHFMDQTGLVSANRKRRPTYPSWDPVRELDFILHSPSITVTSFDVVDEPRLSDHLPLIMDFDT